MHDSLWVCVKLPAKISNKAVPIRAMACAAVAMGRVAVAIFCQLSIEAEEDQIR